MPVRIVVADQSEARFYDSSGPAAPLTLVGRIGDPRARLHDRDFTADRPGRVFDHAPAARGRRGAVAHHDTGGERRPHKREAMLFARRIVNELQTAQRNERFDGIALMAGPAFLGLLRSALPKSLRARVVAEVVKDLVHEPVETVSAHLPRQAFSASYVRETP